MWLSRFVASQLFQVAPHDPTTVGAVAALLVAVCTLTAFVSIRRATWIDPVDALREE
jgi:ABC-type antimicrobial peptide transport system permease subunit